VVSLSQSQQLSFVKLLGKFGRLVKILHHEQLRCVKFSGKSGKVVRL